MTRSGVRALLADMAADSLCESMNLRKTSRDLWTAAAVVIQTKDIAFTISGHSGCCGCTDNPMGFRVGACP